MSNSLELLSYSYACLTFGFASAAMLLVCFVPVQSSKRNERNVVFCNTLTLDLCMLYRYVGHPQTQFWTLTFLRAS
jgi:hypothetical protein